MRNQIRKRRIALIATVIMLAAFVGGIYLVKRNEARPTVTAEATAAPTRTAEKVAAVRESEDSMATRGMTEFRADGVDYTVNDPNIAPEFNAASAYSKGDYVNYQGDLYRLTADHAANDTWANTSKTKIKLGAELATEKANRKTADETETTARENGDASVLNQIAPVFDADTAYTKGQYVTYNGKLYRLTAEHASGTGWSSTSKTAVKISAEMNSKEAGLERKVSDLESDVTYRLIYNEPKNMSHSDSDWTSGAYVDNGNGSIISSSSLSYSAKMPVNVGDVITLYDYYNGSFALRQIRSVAAYNSNNEFVSTPDSLGWKVNSYTVPPGVAYIILSTNSATQYMPVANTTVSAYEAWFEPYYIATYDFIKDAVETGRIAAKNLQNGFACALPKTKFRQTVGIPCVWYKSSMATPPSIYAYVNAGYSRTTNSEKTFSFSTTMPDATNNGYVWYEYDPFMNLIYKFDNNTGYGEATVVKALNLSNCSLLAIGDSTVDHDTMTAKLLSFFTENEHTITLLGTLGSTDPLNRNEGRAGWTTADYLANTVKNGYTNPFWNPTTGEFDFTYYMSQQGYSGVDFVVIQLGINDLYPTNPREIHEPNYTTIWSNIRTMIDSIFEYNSNVKVIINLPTTPNSNPEAHLTSEAVYQNYVIKYNELALSEIYKIGQSKVRASYCHLILDPATEIRDNVHPTVAGYEKMALEVVNQINCWQNGV